MLKTTIVIYVNEQDATISKGIGVFGSKQYGKNDSDRKGLKSTDEKYNELMSVLREKIDVLAEQIAEKVYEHEFLLR